MNSEIERTIRDIDAAIARLDNDRKQTRRKEVVFWALNCAYVTFALWMILHGGCNA